MICNFQKKEWLTWNQFETLLRVASFPALLAPPGSFEIGSSPDTSTGRAPKRSFGRRGGLSAFLARQKAGVSLVSLGAHSDLTPING